MKNLLLLVSFMLTLFNINAQQISNELLSNSGYNSKNEIIQLDWSLGQIVSTTSIHSDLMLTQGFHQPYKILLINDDKNIVGQINRIHMWPNPTQSHLVVELTEIPDQNADVSVLDINGNKVNQITTYKNFDRININMEKLPTGIYLVQVIGTTGLLLQQQKVVKSN